MKKILILNGSIRKKTTFSILKTIEGTLEAYQCEFVNISDYIIKPCIGCENCLRNGNCYIDDDAQVLLNKMDASDGLIIGSPIYLRHISGYLKMLIDRGCAWYHRSPLVGKPIFFVTSTQVSGSKNAMRYLKDISLQWGTIYTGSLSRSMFDFDKPIEPKALNAFRNYLDAGQKNNYKPSLNQIIEFNTQKVLAMHVLPLDFEFWHEKGYLQRPFFYACRINLFKKWIGYVYFKLLSYIILKNKKMA